MSAINLLAVTKVGEKTLGSGGRAAGEDFKRTSIHARLSFTNTLKAEVFGANSSYATYHNGDYPEETAIGIALGSPCQSPITTSPAVKHQLDTYSPSSLSAAMPSNFQRPELGASSARSGAGRWRTLGGLLGLKGHPHLVGASSPSQSPRQYSPRRFDVRSSEEQSYQQRNLPLRDWDRDRDRTVNGQYYDLTRQLSPSDRSFLSQEGADNGLRRKTSLRKRYFAKKDAKTYDGAEGQNSVASSEAPQRVPNRNGLAKESNRDRGNERPRVANRSLLQVEIPNVEMERYSVMFSNVLQTTRQPSPQRQPSLLARRQGELGGLKTLGRTPLKESLDLGSLPKEDKEGAMRSPTKSPSFSLFPSSLTAADREAGKRERGRDHIHRFAKTPDTTSPSRAGFEFFDHDNHDQVIVLVHSPEGSTAKDLRARDGRAGNKQSPSTTHNNQKPALGTTVSISSREPARNDSPRRLQKKKYAAADPSSAVVETSIARQISTSHQQQQQLAPVVPKFARQPLQPTVVDIAEDSAMRKSYHSHHLVFDGT
ncbi:MAG: hypothetical protein Q9167_000256 [Letrouitia subvulpina]